METPEKNQKLSQPQGIKLKVEDQDAKNSLEKEKSPDLKLNENQLNGESEREPSQELVEKWVDRWMSREIIDKYALSYEGSKKSPEEKRQNQKYKKHYQKGEETKKCLKDRLGFLILSKKINKDLAEEEIKEKILKILKSDIRATRLVKIIKEHNFNKKTEEVNIVNQKIQGQVFSVPGLANLKNLSKKTEEKSTESQEKPKENPEEFISSADSVLVSDLDKLNKNNEKDEIPKTEKDFFKKFEKYGSYFDPQDGSEFKILGYDSEKQEVEVYRYQSFVYNKEKKAWGTPAEKGRKESLNYQQFLDLIKKSVSDSEYFKDQEREIEQEKTKEKEELEGFYINDRGDYFKQKYYLKSKEGNEYVSGEGEIEVEFDPKIKTNKNIFKTSELKDFINRGGFDFFEKGTDIKKAFEKDFNSFEDKEEFKILSFDYRAKEGKYLAEIEERGKSRLINVKDLKVLIKKMDDEKEVKKVNFENNLEELNETEKKVFEIFKTEVESYKKGVYEKTKENSFFQEDTRVLIVRDYLNHYLEEKLASRINDKIKEYHITNVNQERILSFLLKHFNFLK